MSKRRAPEDLDAMEDVASPAPKKRKSQGHEDVVNGTAAPATTTNGRHDVHVGGNKSEGKSESGSDAESDESDTETDVAAAASTVRQAAPTAGYSDLYLDTIDRQVLDFDFEKLCSVSLSNINVYACLVCGRYYQGRGPRSFAYFHALDEDHHVFINMQTQRVYVLPEGYEVQSRSLDDIKFVADPRYTRADVARLDRGFAGGGPLTCYTLTGKPYTPGFVGMNNIKENDYLNVVVQALAHVAPLRSFFLLDEFAAKTSGGGSSNSQKTTTAASAANSNAELVRRFGLLVRKIWNPRAFKAHVSPHELLQEVALRSNRRFTLTAQSDPVDFLTWFLNHLHLGLGGSRTRPRSSIVQRVFQGRVRVTSEKLEAVGAAAAAAAAAAAEAAAATEEVAVQVSGEQQQQQQFPPPPPPPTDAMQIDPPLSTPHMQSPQPPPPGTLPMQPPPPGVGMSSFASFQQPPPPGVSTPMGGFSLPPPPPPAGPPGVSAPGAPSPLMPPPSSFPPPSSSAAIHPPGASSSNDSQQQQQQQEEEEGQQGQSEREQQQQQQQQLAPVPPAPTAEVSRFLLLTLDLPPAPLFQDEQERNIIPQVPLTTLLEKYDGHTAREQGDVRRWFRLRAPLPPYLVLHMKRFSANKFVTERNPTIVTFDPRGLNMRPYVEDDQGRDLSDLDVAGDDDDPYIYDLVANVVHEAVRARGDDVAVDSAEERRTWKVQLRDKAGAPATTTDNIVQQQQDDRWVVAQDLFVEPVAGELLYLAESYIQIWERRRRSGGGGGSGSSNQATTKPGKGKAKVTNGGAGGGR
ncbi:snRNP assembly protein [Niveomyces insectorum RCEF 264]|uniref:SnRNP assembly protein n=1 Tax=Niveomyces insectorum RCEF 264 TaxID=1081102 RepID=A0A167TZS0_9HYPO|nr:snRNP assembly protein [Niveomyces insectorum RCEF 264]